MQESIVFLVREQCRRKESSRSLSHLLMSFLFLPALVTIHKSFSQTEKKTVWIFPNSEDLDPPIATCLLLQDLYPVTIL